MSVFMYGVYALISDAINISRDTTVDKALADLGAGNFTYFFFPYKTELTFIHLKLSNRYLRSRNTLLRQNFE